MIQAMIPLMKPSAVGARIVNVSSRLGRLNGRRNVSNNSIFVPCASVHSCVHARVPFTCIMRLLYAVTPLSSIFYFFLMSSACHSVIRGEVFYYKLFLEAALLIMSTHNRSTYRDLEM